ncbi:putative 2OG-Fe(II) oxygenase [Pseudoalteromonas sp. THAF3]|uniref:putative 2OG-Fe(II) oxygenase n=1 Tax=Pseudoalteromonas sp. THAF3 TaxID=2587843 RepID=UPI0026576072|nr:putative 2OG-Fe(II) oxygenase [Pseudoalteromonas sp. THAF3]
MSAPAYIQVPQSMHENDPIRSGWLRLGETCLNLGEREQINKLICSQSGRIIIFPSYLWHGTYPITSEQPRITLPTDIMPTA